MKILIAGLMLLATSVASAQWTVRPQAGIGFTNNANYESTDKDSDFFWWARASSVSTGSDSSWSLWLNYRDYFKENQNDVFSYRLGRVEELSTRPFGTLDWDVAAGGQKYTQGSPATTEESLDNIYAETSIRKSMLLRQNLETSFGPLYQIKTYPEFSGRTDHTFLFNADLDWSFAPSQSLAPYAEIGFVISSQSLYTKNYLEFGADWSIYPSPTLKYIFHAMSKFSTYPNRKTTEETVVTSKNGKIQRASHEEIEAQTFHQVQAIVAKMVGKTEFRASMALNTQNSRSGYEDYTEMQVFGSVLIPLDSPRRRK